MQRNITPFILSASGLRIALGCLLLVVLLVYVPLYNASFMTIDDTIYIANNPFVATGLKPSNIVRAFTNSHSANWHPVTWISHMVDVQLFGMNAGGHHLTNVVIHLVNIFLLFVALRGMTGSTYRSLLVSALFGLHPLNVESVAWIAERKNVLSMMFFLLTVIAYTKYCKSKSKASSILVLVWYSLGLMSKPMLVTVPFLFVVLDFWPLRRINTASLSGIRSLIIEKAPLFVLAAATSIIAYLSQKGYSAVAHYSLYSRCANAAISYVLYIYKMVVPIKLSVFYPYPPTIPLWKAIAAGILYVSLFGLAVAAYKKRPWLTAGWLWYVGTLIPVIGLVPVGSQAMADRYAYVPLIGLFICMVWTLPDMRRRNNRMAMVVSAALVVVVSTLSLLTNAQAQQWRSSETILRHSIAAAGGNWLCENNLAIALRQKGSIDSAKIHLLNAVTIRQNYEEAWYNLGVLYANQQKNDSATGCFERALCIDPQYAGAHHGLARMLESAGKDSLAERHYYSALVNDSAFWLAWQGLGGLYEKQGNIDHALCCYKRAIAMADTSWESRYNLGMIYVKKKDYAGAIEHLMRAIALDTMNWQAWNGLGFALRMNGQFRKAADVLSRAVAIAPDSLQPHLNRGIALLELERLDSAAADLRFVLRLKPDCAEAHYFLGEICKKKGSRDSADVHYTQARSINPQQMEYGTRISHIH